MEQKPISKINKYIKDYKIKDRIGVGSYGIVYKVTKKNNEKQIYVLKQIPFNLKADINNETLIEAKNEALILSKLKHKYIVKYYDSFQDNNNLNIVMEYCEYGDLDSYIKNLKKNNKHLSENQIWKFFIEICTGLSYMHNKKILHRDMKSSNIFLTKNLDIKIGDLGVAKALKNTLHAHTFIGTPYYLSPEICEEKPYNEKSDVWALGCILYELINLKHPFNASNQAALFLKILNGKYENFSNIYKYSDELLKFIDLLLEKDFNKRPSMKDIIFNPIFKNKAKLLGLNDYISDSESINELENEKKNRIKKISYISSSAASKNKKNNNLKEKTRKSSVDKSKINPNINILKVDSYNSDYNYNLNKFNCHSSNKILKVKKNSAEFIQNINNGNDNNKIKASFVNIRGIKKRNTNTGFNINNKIEKINIVNNGNIHRKNSKSFITNNNNKNNKQKNEILLTNKNNDNNAKIKNYYDKKLVNKFINKSNNINKKNIKDINEINKEKKISNSVYNHLKNKQNYFVINLNDEEENINNKNNINNFEIENNNKKNDVQINFESKNLENLKDKNEESFEIIKNNNYSENYDNNSFEKNNSNNDESLNSSYDSKEEICIIERNNNDQKNMEDLFNKKQDEYNNIKNNMMKYKDLININNIFNLLGSKTIKNEEGIENIFIVIKKYMKELPIEKYKSFKMLFKRLILCEIEIKRLITEFPELIKYKIN